jgi:hypothetical protein
MNAARFYKINEVITININNIAFIESFDDENWIHMNMNHKIGVSDEQMKLLKAYLEIMNI